MKRFRVPRRASMVMVLTTALVLSAALAGPALARHQPRPVAAGPGVFVDPTVGSSLWLKSLDPAQVTDSNSISIIQLVYSGLVRLDDRNNVAPDLAQSMPVVSKDGLTYTFTLRPNLAYSDGTPLTAADVAASITRSLSKAANSPNALLYLGHIKGAADWNSGKAKSLTGIAAPDARTVRITLDRPISYFLQTLTYPTSFVVKPGLAPNADLIGPSAQSRNIGSGPFMFSRAWRYHQEMYLAPNPHWYEAGRMRLKELDVPFISTPDTAYSEYRSGQIPLAGVPSADLAAARGSADLHSSPTLSTYYLVPNLGRDARCKPVGCAPFDDPHFRRALLYAVDRQTLATKILHGTVQPLCGLIPQGIAGYDPTLCALAPYDPARARTELALARKDFGGHLPHEGNLSVFYPSGSQDLANVMTALENEWTAVGLNVAITARPQNTYLTLISQPSTPFIIDNWVYDYADPQDFADNLIGAGSTYNIGNYTNPAVQSLLDRADVTPNGPARTALYVQAQRQAMIDVAFIELYQPVSYVRWQSTIHGLVLTPAGAIPTGGDWTNVSVGS